MQFTDLQIGSKVKKIISETRGMTIKYLAEKIDMSATGLQKALIRDTLGVEQLLIICAILKRPITDFVPIQPFIDEDGELQLILDLDTPIPQAKKVESKQVMQLKDELIESQKKMMELMQKLHNAEQELITLKLSKEKV